MSEENKVVARRVVEELFNHTGNLDAADELFAPTYVGHEPAFGDLHGIEAVKQFAATERQAIPGAGARWPCSPARAALVLLEERQVGEGPAAHHLRHTRFLGVLGLPQLRRPLARAALLGGLAYGSRASERTPVVPLEVIHALTRPRSKCWGGHDRRIDAETLEEVGWSTLEGPATSQPYSTELAPGHERRKATAAPLRRVRPKSRGVFEDLPSFFQQRTRHQHVPGTGRQEVRRIEARLTLV